MEFDRYVQLQAAHDEAIPSTSTVRTALGGYVAEHDIGRRGPVREHYVVGPDEAPDAADLRTELCWPIP